MDARRKAVAVLALAEYKKLQEKYAVHFKNMTEHDSKRRRYVCLFW